ncbi:MAG: hypothetical protein IH591_01805 [Bacteroidales bacterium]|nr:hypothetical protein [Bacteroidales bacterium]
MKRNLLIAFILAGTVTSLSGQDRIITYNNDTIHCEILKISISNILYRTSAASFRSTNRVPLSEVQNFSVSAVESSMTKYKPVMSDRYSGLRLGLSVGAGYNLNIMDENLSEMVLPSMEQDLAESLIARLRSGILVNADILWLLSSGLGVGLQYKFINSSASFEGFVDQYPGPDIVYLTFKERVYVNFIGVELLYRESLDEQKRFYVYCNGSFGPAIYRQEYEYYYYHGNSISTGKTFGMEGTVGFEFFINPHLSVGAGLSGFNAVIKKVVATDGIYTLKIDLPEERYENLSRIDLSLGIKLYLWEK